MLVRRNSPPNRRSCLLIFQEKLSTSWLLVSTRCRGSPEVAPGWAKKLVPPLGVADARMIGRPDELQEGAVSVTLQSPMELGSKAASCGKNPSAKRFQP